MAQYVNDDMTLANIASSVLQEYHEPVAGSVPIPLDIVYDKINATYQEVFNAPVDLTYFRENDYTFQTVEDTTINQTGGIAAGATSFVVTESANFPNATRTILIGGTDFAQYTTNTTATDTLSGVTGVDVAQDDGASVQLGYPLSGISDLDEQQINAVWIDGIPYEYEQPEVFFNKNTQHYQRFSVYESNLYLPPGTGASIATMIYQKELTLMTDVSHKPSLIPGKFRYGLLVEGAIVKIGVRDDLRTGYDWHEKEFEKAKKMFYAAGNNRVKSKNKKRWGSIYD